MKTVELEYTDYKWFDKELLRYMLNDNFMWSVIGYHIAAYTDFEENNALASERTFSILCEYLRTNWKLLTDRQRAVLRLKDLEQETCSFEFSKEFKDGETYFANIQSLVDRTRERMLIDASFDRWGCPST